MYGRADGMPSFQLTVAVCAGITKFVEYDLSNLGSSGQLGSNTLEMVQHPGYDVSS
jgi:hypothetical protein